MLCQYVWQPWLLKLFASNAVVSDMIQILIFCITFNYMSIIQFFNLGVIPSLKLQLIYIVMLTRKQPYTKKREWILVVIYTNKCIILIQHFYDSPSKNFTKAIFLHHFKGHAT
jgi:hypothetical protein